MKSFGKIQQLLFNQELFMLSLEQALDYILETPPADSMKNIETLSLEQANNRVCAQNVISPINVPSFDNSAMDGYAVRLKD